jgi:hypothetical protein
LNRSSETDTLSPNYRVRDLAYTAAMVDGEGYITADTRDALVEVGITNTSKVLMDYFLTVFGGSIQVRKPTGLGKKVWYVWYPTDSLAFLRVISPHLKIKRSQCLLAIGVLKQTGKKGSTPARRRKLVARLHTLNRDGIVQPTSDG